MKNVIKKMLYKFNLLSRIPRDKELEKELKNLKIDDDILEDNFEYLLPIIKKNVIPEEILNLIEDLRYVNPDRGIRDEKIINTLSKLGEKGVIAAPAIEHIIEKLFNKNPLIRSGAEQALYGINKEYHRSKESISKIPYLFKRLNKDSNQINIAITFLLKMDKTCENEILDEIRNKENYDIQIKLLPILAVIKPVNDETLPLMFEKLGDKTPEQVKQVVLKSLSKIGLFDDVLFGILRNMIKQGEPSGLRISALKCLEKFNELSLDATPNIIDVLDDDNYEVRKAGIEALVSIGNQTVPYLLKAIKIKPTFSERDKKELKEKMDVFMNTDKTIMWFSERNEAIQNINWSIDEFNRVINRPFLFNESILVTLMKLGFDIDRLDEYLEVIKLTEDKYLLEYNVNQISKKA